MDALVRAAATAAAAAGAADRPMRVVLLPTAAARQRPDLAADHGRSAFEASGRRLGVVLAMEVAFVVDRETAASQTEIAKLEAADLVHMPGGDRTRSRPSPAARPRRRRFWGPGPAGPDRRCERRGHGFCDHVWTRAPDRGARAPPRRSGRSPFQPVGDDSLATLAGTVIARPSTTRIGLDERTAILGMPGEESVARSGKALLTSRSAIVDRSRSRPGRP